MKFAENGATSLFKVKPNNKVYSSTSNIGVILLNKITLDKDMSVGSINSRATATFSKGVVVRVIKKDYNKVLRRFYTSKKVEHHLEFVHE